jgi:transcriptional regulator with XRE-family HTH domain
LTRPSNILDDPSIMKETASPDINQRIAGRVRDLRSARGQSLETLAQQSGVSRSMISLIERGESSATAVVLEKLAASLGVSLAALFEDTQAPVSPIARRETQPQWRDPASGYLRRNLSPAGLASPLQLVEIEFPPGARVAYESGVREVPMHQQVWVLAGSIEVSIGDEQFRLEGGDCLAMVLDRPTAYRNPGRKAARYLVAIASDAALRRRA